MRFFTQCTSNLGPDHLNCKRMQHVAEKRKCGRSNLQSVETRKTGFLNTGFYLKRKESTQVTRSIHIGIAGCGHTATRTGHRCYLTTFMTFLSNTHVSLHSSSSVICQTTGPQPLPKRFLHLMRSRASSFKWEYPLLSPRSSSNCLRLLPRLLVTSIRPFIFPSMTSFRRQFLRKIWPTSWICWYKNAVKSH
jgi:hypothetical protein